jgi:hypothetical protein
VILQHLFAGDSLRERLDGELREAAVAVSARDPDWLLDRTDDEAVAELMTDCAIEPLEILWEQASTPGIHEETVELHNVITRSDPFDRRPIHAPADAIAITVPFTGDRSLLLMRPSTWSMSPPQAALRARELVFRHAQPKLTLDQVQAAFERFRTRVGELAAQANADVEAHNRARGPPSAGTSPSGGSACSTSES